jgi:hypothetical protein
VLRNQNVLSNTLIHFRKSIIIKGRLEDMQKADAQMTGEQVMELMRKSFSEFWKKVRGEE